MNRQKEDNICTGNAKTMKKVSQEKMGRVSWNSTEDRLNVWMWYLGHQGAIYWDSKGIKTVLFAKIFRSCIVLSVYLHSAVQQLTQCSQMRNQS